MRKATRKALTRSTSADNVRSVSMTVKKLVPLGTKLRRYQTICEL
jgi:hypothetical protein